MKQAPFTDAQVKFLTDLIRAECEKAMVGLKKQLDKEILQDKAELEAKIEATASASAPTNNSQLVAVSNQQLTLATANIRKETQALVAAAMNKAAQTAYDRTMAEVKPVLASTIQMVQYQAQDGHEIVDNYRRAVYKQSEGEAGAGPKMLTSGKSERQVTDHMVKFFDESD
jgi:4-hydroxy-L-threonine phosphate dehydrogenase PdxA